MVVRSPLPRRRCAVSPTVPLARRLARVTSRHQLLLVAEPIAQIWTSLARPWAIAPGVKAYPENPDDVPALAEAWRARFTG